MQRALRLAALVDGLNRRLGRLVGWLCLAMVLIGAFNAVARYLDRGGGARLSSNAWVELQWYLFSAVFLLGAPYALRGDAHVRVDVIYGRLSARAKAWIDLVGGLLLLLPFSLFSVWLAWPSVRDSWAVGEVSPDPGGLPRYPIKTLILVSFALLALQGLSEVIKRLALLRGASPDEVGLVEPPPPGTARPAGEAGHEGHT